MNRIRDYDAHPHMAALGPQTISSGARIRAACADNFADCAEPTSIAHAPILINFAKCTGLTNRFAKIYSTTSALCGQLLIAFFTP